MLVAVNDTSITDEDDTTDDSTDDSMDEISSQILITSLEYLYAMYIKIISLFYLLLKEPTFASHVEGHTD